MRYGARRGSGESNQEHDKRYEYEINGSCSYNELSLPMSVISAGT